MAVLTEMSLMSMTALMTAESVIFMIYLMISKYSIGVLGGLDNYDIYDNLNPNCSDVYSVVHILTQGLF